MRRGCLSIVIWLTISACGADRAPTGIVCAGIASISVYVGVVDAHTNAPAARGASLSAIGSHQLATGLYTDTTAGGALSDSLMVVAAVPGSYAVTVRRAGYLDWTTSLVVADDVLCTHRDYSLNAALVPVP